MACRMRGSGERGQSRTLVGMVKILDAAMFRTGRDLVNIGTRKQNNGKTWGTLSVGYISETGRTHKRYTSVQ